MPGIVVGTDGSEVAAHALTWATREADLRGWPLTAVMAWGLLDQHRRRGEEFDPGYGDDEAKADLRSEVVRVLGEERAGAVELRTVCDHPAPALLDAAADAELLVVGARGLGGFKGMLLGSVSQHVVHHATMPVAIVREEVAVVGTAGRVVVGVDGSELAQRALRWAVNEARARVATLEVVHGWELPYAGGGFGGGVSVDPTFTEEAAREVLETAIAAVDTEGVQVSTSLVPGGGGGALVTASKGAALVVVGSRGRGGFSGLLLGSVGLNVARHAECAVVVVPAGADAGNGG